ncbi:MAG TPA: RNA polymerase sigma factor [Candidatus Anaerotignum merdipullorum]|nr:RNA polymerase sigma factor [Candidatus Anaerotignum merdipullorum]
MQQDPKAILTAHITANQDRYYRLAFSYVHNREAAMDVVQNAVVKGLEHAADIREPAYLRTWFFRIVINESLAYLRKYGKEILWEPTQFVQAADVETQQSNSENVMLEEVMELPEEMRIVIILRFYEELSLNEIAHATGLSLSKVKYRLYAALKKLRQQYERKVEA